MTRPPILPGMRVGDRDKDPWRIASVDETQSDNPRRTNRLYGPLTPDYADAATCGALMAWCHHELERVIAETPKPMRPHLNAARVALNEAKPWHGASVERAVTETTRAMSMERP